jgi:DNA-binding transcriptional regulator LsrR (DeoR family)
MESNRLGPDRQVQIAHIAQQHFVQGKTRIEIAEETGLSRFKVGRILDDAVSSGMVRFEISSPSGIDLDLSLRLKKHFSLERGLVVDVPSEIPEVMQERLGTTAADLLTEILGDTDVLGLAYGRTISVLANSLRSLPPCDVVQLAGVAGPIQETGVEVMRRVSSMTGRRPWTIYSPLVVTDAQTAEGIRRQHGTKETFDQFKRITVAVVGVGSWSPPDSQMMKNPALSREDRDKMLKLGVLAEIGATLIADKGRVVHDLDDRCIAISEVQLRQVPHVMAIAGGQSKTTAIKAVLDSGLVNSLVTDAATARRLLEG